MSTRSSDSSDAMVEFLKDRVESNQGISLQGLTGHLSQLPYDLRTKYGGSVKSLKLFLQRFPNVFLILNQNNVYVWNESFQSTSATTGSVEGLLSSTPDRGIDKKGVTCLTEVRGTVHRMFHIYGFISVKQPIKTTVYFDVHSFENAKHTSLSSSGLKVGESVILDAKAGPKDRKAEFRASRVNRLSTTKLSSSPCLSLHSVAGREGGDCNTITQLVKQHGVIEAVKPNYGFIKFGRNQEERAFFHANIVDKSLGQCIKNLPDVLTIEDKVRFDAKRSNKPSVKVKWEATSLYLCRSTDNIDLGDFEEELRNEVFMSDDDSENQDREAKLEEYEGRKESPVGHADFDASSAEADSCDSSVKGKSNARPLSERERRQKLTGERGFFYPVTKSVGTVKFGPSRGSAASAAVEVTYHDKKPIGNLLWEMAVGQEVSFDAIQAEDSTWVATLVWIGQRPAKPLVGDSENALSRITNKGRGAGKPVPNAEPRPRGDFDGKDTLQNMSPEPHSIHSSISTYKGIKGTIVQIMECVGICEVQELAVSRKIKFTSEFFYKDGTVIMDDLNEVLQEGDSVYLDYMVVVSGTKEQTHCDLVWQGRRPKEVRQMSPDEFWHRLQIDNQDGEYSLGFQDFDREIEKAEEASQGLLRVLSNAELQECTLPRKGKGASSSVSVAGASAAKSTVASTRTHMMYPGYHNESCNSESTADASSIFIGMTDEEVSRLAKMVAVEIIAEKERLRAALRDVGVQTVDEELLPKNL